MADELKKECKRLKNLKQNRDKDSSFIEKIARISLWKKQIDLSSRFKKDSEKELAEKLFNSYLENYEINSYNEMQNLSDLVYEEVLKQKIQIDIDAIMGDEKSKFVPDKLVQNLHNVEERIWKLKEKIGILSEKDKDDLTALQELEEKFSVYIPFNRNEFTLYMPYKCSNCKTEDIQPILLRRRVKDFKVLKHPAFCGRFLYNIEIIDDVKKELITKEQASRYLKTSVAMIDWILENEHNIIQIEGITQDKIDKFVNDNPNLRSADFYQGDKYDKK